MTFSYLRRPSVLLTAAVAAVAAVLFWHSPLYGAESAVVLPPPAVDNPKAPGGAQTAVLSGGCFWGVQGVFEHLKGVTRVVAGYAGGERSTADYETVSGGETGHAESVEISFDPAQVSYGQILQIAFSVVEDPTEVNRQGPDSGTQYRSEVFYLDDAQKHIAEAYIAQLDKAHAFARPIATRVDPLKGFYPAEAYHQDYLYLHPSQPYIAMFDLPKVDNFKRVFPDLYNPHPVLTRAAQ
jgi:peptide-methionine (S)-S-oxide reductase